MTDSLDVEVGRYALRTFNLARGQLNSVTWSIHRWEGGTAVAECLFGYDSSHSPPVDDCKCGLYGTVDPDSLIRQFPSYSYKCVAVFAAEGETIIGTKGLRTAAARVVAYWCEPRYRGIFLTECPEADHFRDMAEMLEAYKFPVATAYHPGLQGTAAPATITPAGRDALRELLMKSDLSITLEAWRDLGIAATDP